MPVVKEKVKAEASEQPAEEKDFDTGVRETTDLKIEEQQIEKLRGTLSRLQKELVQRQTNSENNLKQLRQHRDESIVELRDKYDNCLSRGDANAADKVLEEIREVHQNLLNIARNVVDVDSDVSDFKRRQHELRLEMIRLSQSAKANLRQAHKLAIQASQILDSASRHVADHIRKLERTIEDGKKIAEEIIISE